MSIRVERSEVNPAGGQGPITGPPAGLLTKVRVAGAVLAVGAATWAAGTAVGGQDVGKKVVLADTATGLAYLAGLFALALVLLATRATGPRKGRFLPIAELVLLPLAFAFNLVSFGFLDTPYEEVPAWTMPLNTAWPLANALMIVIGVTVVVLARFPLSLRLHVMASGLWFPVAMVGQGLGGAAATGASVGWLLLTYATLGLRLLIRPADVLPTR